jgi:BirA family biotin operon repressor/biotin-[acetyl-CoA-carboxylase] ligase
MAPAETVTLTAWTAVAVARAVEKVTGTAPDIKWVNDLLMGGRKICGILTELSVESETGRVDSIIIGIGVNVNETKSDFPEEIREIAGSLAMALGHPVSRAQVAAAMVEELDALKAAWPAERASYLSAYRKHDITAGSDVMVLAAEGARSAKALSINQDFSLEVEYADGVREALSSGEVSLRLK